MSADCCMIIVDLLITLLTLIHQVFFMHSICKRQVSFTSSISCNGAIRRAYTNSLRECMPV